MQHHLVKVETTETELIRIGIFLSTRNILLDHRLTFRGYFQNTTKGRFFYIDDQEKLSKGYLIMPVLEDRMVRVIRECK